MKTLLKAQKLYKKITSLQEEVKGLDKFLNKIVDAKAPLRVKARLKSTAKIDLTDSDNNDSTDALKFSIRPIFFSAMSRDKKRNNWDFKTTLEDDEALIAFSAVLHYKKQKLHQLIQDFNALNTKIEL